MRRTSMRGRARLADRFLIWWFVTLLFAVLVITSTINEYNVPNVVEVRPVTTDD